MTFRLADSLPASCRESFEREKVRWLRAHGCVAADALAPEVRRAFRKVFTARYESLLDAGMGACCLKVSDSAGSVSGALRFFCGTRYDLDAFVVMPNHVHVLVAPFAGHDLSDILQSWKGFSSREIKAAQGTTGDGRPFWQTESFDHIVRSSEHLEKFRRYILENPKKAGLREGEYVIWEAGS